MRQRATGIGTIAVVVAVGVALSGCVSGLPSVAVPVATPTPTPTAEAVDLAAILPAEAELPGWSSQDESDGGYLAYIDSTCVGPYLRKPEPDPSKVAGRLLIAPGDEQVISVTVRECLGDVKALIPALPAISTGSAAPSLAHPNGIAIGTYGDARYALKFTGKDSTSATGKDYHNELFIACGTLLYEGEGNGQRAWFNERKLENLLAPSIQRFLAAGGCSS